MFTHDGRLLRNWGKVWIAARAATAAELGRPDILKLVFHDTCREAARLTTISGFAGRLRS